MGRDLIHIGQRKTATTWLQAAFAAAAREGLVSLATPAFNQWSHAMRGVDAPARDFGALAAALKNHPGSPRVLSRETLAVFQPIDALTDALKTGWPDAQILITTRNPADYLRSAYSQKVQMGAPITARDFARTYPRNHMLRSHDFNRLHAEYASRFGEENVHFYPYEEIRRAPDAYLAFIDRLVGVPVSAHAPTSRRNASPSPAVLELTRQISEQLHASAPAFVDTGKWRAFLHVAFPAIGLSENRAAEIYTVPEGRRITLDTTAPELDKDMKAAFGAMATVLDGRPLYAAHRDAYLQP